MIVATAAAAATVGPNGTRDDDFPRFDKHGTARAGTGAADAELVVESLTALSARAVGQDGAADRDPVYSRKLYPAARGTAGLITATILTKLPAQQRLQIRGTARRIAGRAARRTAASTTAAVPGPRAHCLFASTRAALVSMG